MKVQIFLCSANSIEYSNGAHMFLLEHGVQYLLKGDFILVTVPEDGIEVQASTLEELQELALKYNLQVTLDGTSVELDFNCDKVTYNGECE